MAQWLSMVLQEIRKSRGTFFPLFLTFSMVPRFFRKEVLSHFGITLLFLHLPFSMVFPFRSWFRWSLGNLVITWSRILTGFSLGEIRTRRLIRVAMVLWAITFIFFTQGNAFFFTVALFGILSLIEGSLLQPFQDSTHFLGALFFTLNSWFFTPFPGGYFFGCAILLLG